MNMSMQWMTVAVVLLLLPGGSWAAGSAASAGLLEAVKHGDFTAARALIAGGADANAADPDGTTALHWAVDQDRVDLVDLLLDAGARATAVNRYGVPPLSLAAGNGSAAVIARLLDARADVHVSLPSGETPLHTAARAGDVAALRLLLVSGADPNAREDIRRQTPLMWAASEGRADAIRLLVESGADLHARSVEEDYKQTTGSLAMLVSRDVYIEFTPLMFAVWKGHLAATRTLLDLGADVNETTPDGTIALVIAAVNAHWEIGVLLLERGADPNAAENGWNALHQTAWTRTLTVGQLPPPPVVGRVSSLDFVKHLLARGVDINARMTKDIIDAYRHNVNRVGATVFFIAAKGGDAELMRLLAAHGADVHIRNASGSTALMVAAGVELWNPGEDTGTPEDHEEAVRVAVELRINVNAVNEEGDTALHGAARLGLVDGVRLLAERGAVLNRPNKAGHTPYMIAVGRDATGRTLFLAAAVQPQTVDVLTALLRQQGLEPDDLPPPMHQRVDVVNAQKARAAEEAKAAAAGAK